MAERPGVRSPGAGAAAELFAGVVGQDAAVEALRRAAAAPVHAYLLVGPSGTGKRAAARAFAAALLCPFGGCGECEDCRTALRATHVDLVVKERQGPSITVDDAREVTRLAARGPVRSARQVLVLTDFHLVDRAAPALLKTIEEPPPTTVFVILADHVGPQLATIASRCVRVRFGPVPAASLEASLAVEGVGSDQARRAASAAGGRLDRARLLARDPGSTVRLAGWAALPGRLDGTGATVVVLVEELLAGAEEALAPVRAQQDEETEERAAAARAAGERGVPGRRELEEAHRRALRRVRVDELRAGLGALAASYRDRLVTAGGAGDHRPAGACLEALDAVAATVESLTRNCNEALALQALLVRLSRLAAEIPPAGGSGEAAAARYGERFSPG